MDTEDDETEEVNFYSEGLSNYATSYVPSAPDTGTAKNTRKNRILFSSQHDQEESGLVSVPSMDKV